MKVYFWGVNPDLKGKITKYMRSNCRGANEAPVFQEISTDIEIVELDELQIYFCVPEKEQHGMTGIGFAKKIRELNSNAVIIFLSGNLMYMVTSLRQYICPAGYFLYDEFDLAMDFVSSVYKRKKTVEERLIHSIEVISDYKKIELSVGSITYFVTYNKKILCYLTNGKCVSFYGTLSGLEKDCGSRFARCHSGYLINTKKIVFVNLTQKYVELAGIKEKIPISRKYLNRIKNLVK